MQRAACRAQSAAMSESNAYQKGNSARHRRRRRLSAGGRKLFQLLAYFHAFFSTRRPLWLQPTTHCALTHTPHRNCTRTYSYTCTCTQAHVPVQAHALAHACVHKDARASAHACQMCAHRWTMRTHSCVLQVSGAPMVDRAGEKKWGSDPAYRHYVANTNFLLPGRPARPAKVE